MSKRGSVRVGMAKRLKLEVPTTLVHKMENPISAEVRRLSDGRVAVRFRTDPKSKYRWGLENTQYGVISVEIPEEDVRYAQEDARDYKFTFSKPDSIRWDNNSVELVMAGDLPPPRKISRVNKRQLAEAKAAAAPVTEAVQIPRNSPPPAQGPMPDLYTLVRQLNTAVQSCGAQVSLREGRVVVRQVIQ